MQILHTSSNEAAANVVHGAANVIGANAGGAGEARVGVITDRDDAIANRAPKMPPAMPPRAAHRPMAAGFGGSQRQEHAHA